ncbi:MAG: tRNA pseudouridine(38-40) synthase TruA [Erysipelotrichales bacterium]|nr:tRNA pseudouridine(38-40) synthase TruA [Erysipelotrichales bacterium]
MRYKVTVAYDGSAYCGWQVQPNGISIQSVIECVLEQITKTPTPIASSGRTDAGVHAKGQVFHFDTEARLNEEQWRKALNSLLPDDIVIRNVEKVNDQFHSRFDAVWKRYSYTSNMGEYDPFRRHYEYEYNRRLDVRAMREAAKHLVGTHNFAAFNANSLEERPNQVRTIYEITVRESKGRVVIEYTGNGFLRYMVRMMTQTLIEVGKRKIKPERVQALLENARKNSVPYNAPAEGLCLEEVGYTDYESGISPVSV